MGLPASVNADALDVVMPVHDIPGNAEVLSRFADGTSLEFGIHSYRGVGDVSALLDNDLLRTVDVEYVHHELLGIIGVFDDLDVLSGHILEFDYVLPFLSYSDVSLSILDDEDELVLSLHAVDRVGVGQLLEECDVTQGILR